MAGNEVTVSALRAFWLLYPDLNFDVALGGVLKIKQGGGQPRTEPISAPGEPSDDFKFALYTPTPEEGASV